MYTIYIHIYYVYNIHTYILCIQYTYIYIIYTIYIHIHISIVDNYSFIIHNKDRISGHSFYFVARSRGSEEVNQF